MAFPKFGGRKPFLLGPPDKDCLEGDLRNSLLPLLCSNTNELYAQSQPARESRAIASSVVSHRTESPLCFWKSEASSTEIKCLEES